MSYGAAHSGASPSKAFQSTILHVNEIDISAFLAHVATNVAYIDISNVRLIGTNDGIKARDDYSLEDVVTHVIYFYCANTSIGHGLILQLPAPPVRWKSSVLGS